MDSISCEAEFLARHEGREQRKREQRKLEIELFGICLPFCFKVTEKQRNGRANVNLKPGGSLFILRQLLGDRAHFYSLKWHYLGLKREDAHKRLIYNKSTIKAWKRAIRKLIKPPYFYAIEVGKDGQIHVHIIADKDAGLLGVRRGGEVVKPLKNTDEDWRRTVSYMRKTPVQLTVDHDNIKADKLPDWRERIETHQQAVADMQKSGRKRLPQLSDCSLSVPTRCIAPLGCTNTEGQIGQA